MFRKMLVLAPHTDDESLGAGGTIARMLEEGTEVHVLCFSKCEKSVPKGFAKNVLEKEFRAATKALGVKERNARLLDFPVRDFPALRQNILEEMVSARKSIEPDLVLLPSSADAHQDHKTVSTEGVRAFKHSTILGYEMPWNNKSFAASAFIKLGEKHLSKKISAVSCYVSQKNRDYASKKFLQGLAVVRGVQCGAKYAEAFEAIKLIL